MVGGWGWWLRYFSLTVNPNATRAAELPGLAIKDYWKPDGRTAGKLIWLWKVGRTCEKPWILKRLHDVAWYKNDVEMRQDEIRSRFCTNEFCIVGSDMLKKDDSHSPTEGRKFETPISHRSHILNTWDHLRPRHWWTRRDSCGEFQCRARSGIHVGNLRTPMFWPGRFFWHIWEWDVFWFSMLPACRLILIMVEKQYHVRSGWSSHWLYRSVSPLSLLPKSLRKPLSYWRLSEGEFPLVGWLWLNGR